MFQDRPLARSMLIVASALGLCIAQGAAAFPEETIDPGVPPSDAPDHSGELFNFGSTFIFSFSRTVGTFVPRAIVNCTTCKFPVANNSVHTFAVTGRVLGQVRENNGDIRPFSDGVYDMNLSISGVRATASTPVAVGDGLFEQTITYTADLTAAEPFNAVVSGTLMLDDNEGTTPQPSPLPPEGRTITVGAEAGVTPGLVTAAGPTQTFPAIPASSPQALGQAVAANVVFQVTETKRGRLPPVIP
jgi:hypothetical protein